MKGRRLIKSQIIEAWSECLNTDYQNQRINSERSLQASMWSQLNKRLGTNRRLFIEPCMTIRHRGAIKRLYPDILVCNSCEVISVIELKYLPRATPQFTKDLNTFDLISTHRSSIKITNERFRGKMTDDMKYSLSKSILFVWAGVHAADKFKQDRIFSEGHDHLEGCYLQLHAATLHNHAPDIYYYEY